MSAYSPIGVGFIHIPKTGGKSMKNWIKENTLQAIVYEQTEHYSASMLLKKHPKIDYFFTIVRNPWSRLVSWYRFLTGRYLDKLPGLLNFKLINFPIEIKTVEEFKNYAKTLTFETYVNNYLDVLTIKQWYNVSTTQTKWLDLPVDLIIKLEHINKEFEKIQRIFNCTKSLPFLNQHGHANNYHYTLFYNEELKKKVAKIFAEDIETFKYKFEE
jgi:hypothetical protein